LGALLERCQLPLQRRHRRRGRRGRRAAFAAAVYGVAAGVATRLRAGRQRAGDLQQGLALGAHVEATRVRHFGLRGRAEVRRRAGEVRVYAVKRVAEGLGSSHETRARTRNG
jgi:hypothetical protein